MKSLLLLPLFVLLLSCNSSTNSEEKSIATTDTNTAYQFKMPSEFYPTERANVLVVGTFHFDYPGLDSHKTVDEDKVDVLLEPKKSEVDELVAYIKKFKPNKIAIEAGTSWKATSKLREYKAGKYQDERSEIFQLGMRIARDFEIDTLYSVNQYSLQRELYKRDSIYHNSLFDQVDWEIEDPYWDMATKWLTYDDLAVKESHLLDYFKYMNSREVQNANFGLYLTGSFATGQGQGADRLSMWWYNRNLRIFSNIVNITEGPEDRILVLMGNGHAAILRQLFEASPQYHFTEFSEL